MIKVGNVLKNKKTSKHYVVIAVDRLLHAVGYDGSILNLHPDNLDSFDVYGSILDVLPVPLATPSALDTQHGGDHNYQPWQVLKAWLTPEEFRGYMKGTAIEYLAREGDLDIKKGAHTLQAFLEMKE